MASIDFVPYPENSHVNATFGLAKELKSRGHRVRYLAPPDFEDHICNQGFDFTPFCEAYMPKGFQQEVRSTPSIFRRVEKEILDKLCEGEFDEVFEKSRSDLMIVDSYAQHFALIAHKVGIPTILLSPTLPRARDPWVPPITKAIVPNSFLSRLKVRLSWLRYDVVRRRLEMKGVRFDQGIPRLAEASNYPLEQVDTRGIFPILKTIPELVLCAKEFDLPRSKRQDNLFYIGPYVDLDRKESADFPWDRLDESKPIIYCSIGMLSYRFKQAKNFLQLVIDALAARPEWQLVMSVGEHLDINDFHSVPPNAILVNRAPQLEILRRASMIITHGGLNSVKEAILLGVSMIVIPWTKPVNAVRVAYHGLGVMADVNAVSVEQLHSMIDTIGKDPSFKTRSKLMRERFLEGERSESGLEIIQSILEAGSIRALSGDKAQGHSLDRKAYPGVASRTR